MNLTQLASKGLDLIYPPALYCSCCGNYIDESRTYHLCDHCISHIRWDASDIKEIDGLKMLRCTEYGLYERTLIFGLKYNGKRYIARDIAEIMADRLSLENFDVDVLVPVPMYIDKEKARGFNHAALIGKYLGKSLNKPHIEHGLIRTENTRPMRGLNPTERSQNVKGKFAINQKHATILRNKRILLIDDFYTTGSTARECMYALQQEQVKDVYFLAFAAR